MSTKTRKTQQTRVIDKEVESKSLVKADLPPLILIMLFMAVDYLPRLNAADVMAPQWIYLAALNVIALFYLHFKKNDFNASSNGLFLLPLSVVYTSFFLLAGISIIWAINQVESIVVYSRFVITFIAYFNIAILLFGRLHLFKYLARFLCILLFFQSFTPIYEFFRQLGDVSLNFIIFNLKGNSANKNILAITIAIKIPFAIYCIYTSKSWWRLIYSFLIAFASLAIFFVNARASFLALFIQLGLICILLLYEYKKNHSRAQLLQQFAFILFPVIFSLLLSQLIISNAASLEEEAQGYGTVAERLGSISLTAQGSNNRLNQWNGALKYIAHNPVTGAGFGNWKLASIPYEREYADDMLVTYHVHNDFLEATTETGILGGLIYAAIFILCAYYLLKTFFSNTPSQLKIIAAFTLIIFSTYVVDAMFNFPMERPIMQMFFVFILALSANLNVQYKNFVIKKNLFIPFKILAILLLVPATYICYLTYQSMVAQAKYNQDVLLEKPVYTSEEVINAFPSIPNMNAFAFPIDAIKARYLIEEKKYDQALFYLRKSDHINPNITFNEYLKTRIFLETKQFDSAAIYAARAFTLKPRAKSNLKLLNAVAYELKDSATITKAFKEAIKYRNEAWVWNDYILLMAALNKDAGYLKELVDSAQKLFPADKELQIKNKEISISFTPDVQEIFNKGLQEFTSGNYSVAISIFKQVVKADPGNYLGYENIGISYYLLNDYKNAIYYMDQVLALKTSMDGKAEYIKGLSLLNSGNDAGCEFLFTSKQKGYKDAQSSIERNCKR